MTAPYRADLAEPGLWKTIGKSVEGRPIKVWVPERASGGTLLIGGVHGDETATILLLDDFLEKFWPRLEQPTAILPMANPDGCKLGSRYNARGVDLNRNCSHCWSPDSVEPSGPEPWSEPEIRALRDFILEWEPRRIVSLHWALAEIDADGAQSRGLAEAMWKTLGPEERGPYRIRVSEGGMNIPTLPLSYAGCPGSLGQWCGYALQYPDGSRPAMVTLELPYDLDVKERPNELPESHLETLYEIWRKDAKAYLRGVERGVHNMLLAACGHDENAQSVNPSQRKL